MANVEVTKPSERGQRGRGLTRGGDLFPSLWSMSPRDFFALNPFELMHRAFGGGERPSVWSPRIEVREKDNQLLVSADLPGLTKDDVKVEITDEGLVIQGERKQEHEERRGGFYHSERNYGRFYRVIALPEDASVDQAKAQFNNGVLEVSVPIPASERKRREIPIETGTKARSSKGGAE